MTPDEINLLVKQEVTRETESLKEHIDHLSDLASRLYAERELAREEERRRVLGLIDGERMAFGKNTCERQVLDFVRRLVESGEKPVQTGMRL